MRRIVHFVLVVTAVCGASISRFVDVGRVDVVKGLRSVMRFDDLDRGSVLDQNAAQALANLGELFRVGRPKGLGCAVLPFRVDAKTGDALRCPAEPKPI